MVVVAIVAIASIGVVASLPDPARGQLEKEGTRLASLLDTARAYSQASGLPVTWTPTATGFRFDGLSESAASDLKKESHWLTPELHTDKETTLILGPEPMIAPQSVTLLLGSYRLRLRTDGLGPFVMAPNEGEVTSATGAAP